MPISSSMRRRKEANSLSVRGRMACSPASIMASFRGGGRDDLLDGEDAARVEKHDEALADARHAAEIRHVDRRAERRRGLDVPGAELDDVQDLVGHEAEERADALQLDVD